MLKLDRDLSFIVMVFIFILTMSAGGMIAEHWEHQDKIAELNAACHK